MAMNWKYMADQLNRMQSEEWSFITKSESWSGVQSAFKVGLEAKIIKGEGLYVRPHVLSDKEKMELVKQQAEGPDARQTLINEEAQRIEVRYEAALLFMESQGEKSRIGIHSAKRAAIKYALEGVEL